MYILTLIDCCERCKLITLFKQPFLWQESSLHLGQVSLLCWLAEGDGQLTLLAVSPRRPWNVCSLTLEMHCFHSSAGRLARLALSISPLPTLVQFQMECFWGQNHICAEEGVSAQVCGFCTDGVSSNHLAEGTCPSAMLLSQTTRFHHNIAFHPPRKRCQYFKKNKNPKIYTGLERNIASPQHQCSAQNADAEGQVAMQEYGIAAPCWVQLLTPPLHRSAGIRMLPLGTPSADYGRSEFSMPLWCWVWRVGGGRAWEQRGEAGDSATRPAI